MQAALTKTGGDAETETPAIETPASEILTERLREDETVPYFLLDKAKWQTTHYFRAAQKSYLLDRMEEVLMKDPNLSGTCRKVSAHASSDQAPDQSTNVSGVVALYREIMNEVSASETNIINFYKARFGQVCFRLVLVVYCY